MSRRQARRVAVPPDPRTLAEAQGFDTGSRAIPVVVEDVAVGTRTTIKVARRDDHLGRIQDITSGMRLAAARFVRYREHMGAGIGAGPPDLGAERVQEHRVGDGLGVKLLSQERAYTASVMYTKGEEAIGMAAIGVVLWVVVDCKTLSTYDAMRKWREGRGRALLVPALERLAIEYGCA